VFVGRLTRPGASSSGFVEISARGNQDILARLYLMGRRPRVETAGAMRESRGVVRAIAKRGVPIDSVCSGAYFAEDGPARWFARHHELAAHPAFLISYPRCETGARRFSSATALSESAGDQRRSILGAGVFVAKIWRRDRAENRARSCSITAAGGGPSHSFSSALEELKAPERPAWRAAQMAREAFSPPHAR